jgi:hypothetical protein
MFFKFHRSLILLSMAASRRFPQSTIKQRTITHQSYGLPTVTSRLFEMRIISGQARRKTDDLPADVSCMFGSAVGLNCYLSTSLPVQDYQRVSISTSRALLEVHSRSQLVERSPRLLAGHVEEARASYQKFTHLLPSLSFPSLPCFSSLHAPLSRLHPCSFHDRSHCFLFGSCLSLHWLFSAHSIFLRSICRCFLLSDRIC